MNKSDIKYQSYIQILKEELIPAMGCTEPIALAYAAAKAREVLGALPDKVAIGASGSIIKNVKSVIVPNTDHLRGIPAAATAPALIIVGLLMLEPVKDIPFDDFSESIPAFVCLIMMPVTYSISNGILLGMITYVLMNVICGKFKKLTIPMYILAVLFVLKFIFI